MSAVALTVVFVGSFVFGRATRSAAASFALQQFSTIPIIGQMSHLVGSPDRALAGEEDDRINVLLLGDGGEGHEGPNLTDTIIVASIKPSTKQVAMLSIPRDLIVPIQGFGWQKINAVNAFAEKAHPGSGPDAARIALEGLLGIDIPYYIRVDFKGFKDVIDGAGGIDVDVDRSFVDTTYPTSDYGVTTISFKKGMQHMDGATALVYARSRHGNNGEGSDFARAARQQKMISALKGKLLSAGTYKNPAAVASAIASLRSDIATNFQLGEVLRIAGMAGSGGGLAISHKVLDNSPSSPLVDGSYGGAYVLLPKNDDWSGVRAIAADLFTQSAPEPGSPAVADGSTIESGSGGAPTTQTKPRVEIRNGSGVAGQARVAASALSDAGFMVVKIGNADSFAYADTVIYDLTKGARPAALTLLKKTMNAKALTPPRSLVTDGKADFVVILGTLGADTASAAGVTGG